MDKPLFNFTSPNVWNVAFKKDLQVIDGDRPNSYIPIRRQNFLIPSPMLLIGTRSTKAKDNWNLGCRVSVNLLLGEFDSGSTFTGAAEIHQDNALLDRLKLMHWKEYEPKPYVVILDIPWWLEQVSIEAYWYDGEGTSAYKQLLEAMDGKLDLIWKTLNT